MTNNFVGYVNRAYRPTVVSPHETIECEVPVYTVSAASQPPATPEPVAWRYRRKETSDPIVGKHGEQPWQYSRANVDVHPSQTRLWEVEPLYASPPDGELVRMLTEALTKCRTSICGYSLNGDYLQAEEVVRRMNNELQRIDGIARAALSVKERE